MLGVGMSFASVASAQDAATVAVEAPVEAATEAAVEADAGDISYISEADLNYTINTLIMFVCAVLVIFMQAGFAMVEVGLNAAKNTVNILAKNVIDLAVGVLL